MRRHHQPLVLVHTRPGQTLTESQQVPTPSYTPVLQPANCISKTSSHDLLVLDLVLMRVVVEAMRRAFSSVFPRGSVRHSFRA
jgi:hypothetical protein